MVWAILLGWLGILSCFDLRKKEIPHSAWVVLPLIGTCIFQVWQGHLALVLLTVIVSAASEREWLSGFLNFTGIARLPFWIPLLLSGFCLSAGEFPAASLAVLGFWIAWEFNFWGGADAVAAITLMLIYPEWAFILAFLLVHVLTLFVLVLLSLYRGKGLVTHQVPGLPLLFLSVLLLGLHQFVYFS